MQLARGFVIFWSLLWVSGSSLPARAASEPVEYTVSATEDGPAQPVEDPRLSVGIRFLDPAIPDQDAQSLEDEGIFPAVRKSESRHFAVRLREALAASDTWRKVQVVPEDAPADLTLHGKILRSNGTHLTLRVWLVDASGRTGFKRRYRARVDPEYYDVLATVEREESGAVSGPFGTLYDQVANDLEKWYLKRSARELRELRWITRLKLGEDLAPMAFQGFLESGKSGDLTLARLPAEGDPLLASLRRLENAHDQFLDTVTVYQAAFSDRFYDFYEVWQRASFENWLALKEKHKERMQALPSPWDPDAEMTGGRFRPEPRTRNFITRSPIPAAVQEHEQIERALGSDLDHQVEPMLIEVEGQTLRLQGTLEAQYATWRRLLRELFAAETGGTLR